MAHYRERQIAVIGVSDQPDKYGYKIFNDLLAAGYRVSGVNPRGIEVNGRQLFKTLKEVTPKPDFVITVVPASVTEKVVDDCQELGIKEIWMQPGSESRAAVEKAESYGIKVTSGACFMVVAGEW
jgi:uncharacterized protein